MTLSEKDRLENIDFAFSQLMAELGDRSISSVFFQPTNATLKDIQPTTWKELVNQGWIKKYEISGEPHYRFTGRGWIEGLWRTGAGKCELLAERIGRLGAALKKYIKGRKTDVIVEFQKLVQDVEIPKGWVFNAIESTVFEELYKKRSASWEERGALVKVPLDFGTELLDHSADLRAQLEEVERQLEIASQELSEFTCSFCGAPIVGQDSYPISEHDDGYYISYACGRYDSETQEQPCPSDPSFPKLEDYEFQFKEGPDKLHQKWSCWAKPTTPAARMLGLRLGNGKTKEEARQQVIDSYTRTAKPWR